MPRSIPAGSVIELEKATLQNLKYGDVVYVHRPDRSVLCRFLRLWRSNDEYILMLAQPGVRDPLALPSGALLGRVARVMQSDNKVSFPNNESPLLRLWPRLTDYGTRPIFGL
jgi:hypothetical protein